MFLIFESQKTENKHGIKISDSSRKVAVAVAQSTVSLYNSNMVYGLRSTVFRNLDHNKDIPISEVPDANIWGRYLPQESSRRVLSAMVFSFLCERLKKYLIRRFGQPPLCHPSLFSLKICCLLKTDSLSLSGMFSSTDPNPTPFVFMDVDKETLWPSSNCTSFQGQPPRMIYSN